MVSTGAGLRGGLDRAPGMAAFALVSLGLLVGPLPLGAQALAALGVRGGAGVDSGGRTVYDGGIELTDAGGSTAIQVAVRGLGEARWSKSYQLTQSSRTDDYDEEMSLWGIGLMANFLFRYSREARGPYLLFGLGVGSVWFDWRLETSNPRLGTGLPGGGSFREERGRTVGSMLNAGIGQRVLEHVDIRAQVTGVLVPSTDLREDLVIVPVFTLTSGIGF